MKKVIHFSLVLILFSNFSFASIGNPEKTTVKEDTPLCLAISNGEMDLIKQYVEYGVDVNQESNGITPLMLASQYNKVEIVKYLISKGANTRARDENGFTALRYAERSNAKEAVALLK
jgi:ankyrin repeat protein